MSGFPIQKVKLDVMLINGLFSNQRRQPKRKICYFDQFTVQRQISEGEPVCLVKHNKLSSHYVLK